MEIGPIIVTTWVSPEDDSHAIGCPLCREWSEISPEQLDQVIDCPKCEGALKVNPFTLNADWRPVAAAWRGDGS
jgi:hypothetical protein